jgi:hypothetical protein
MNIKKDNPVSRLVTRFGFNDNISKQQSHQRSWIIRGQVLIVKQINVMAFHLKFPGSTRSLVLIHFQLTFG